MGRAQRRAKDQKRSKRRQQHTKRSSNLVTVLELDGVSDPAQAQSLLSYMGLPQTPILAAEGRPALAVMSVPGRAEDCVIVADGGRTLGVLHGTDCNLSINVQKQIGNPQPEPFNSNCARRAAGGVFRVLDVNEMGS